MKISEYKDLFISESQEMLASFNKNLVELEKDPSNIELINEIFRHSHTIKGMAGSMGYEDIVNLSHKMEDVLGLLREKIIKIDKNTIDLLFQSVDKLETLIETVRKDEKKKIDVSGLVNRLEELTKKLPDKEKEDKPEHKIEVPELAPGDIEEIIKKRSEGYVLYKAAVILNEKCRMREPRAFVILKTIGEMGEVIKYDFVCNQIKTKKLGCQFELLLLTKSPPREIKKRIMEISEVSGITLEEQKTEDREQKTEDRGQMTDDREQKTEVHKTVETQTIRVGLDKLDNLMNLVGELVINKIRLIQISQTMENKDLGEAITQMGRLTGELQIQTMQVRLVPLSYIFDRFPRMVRDLAGSEKKEVDLEIGGSEIGMDRTILDEINDPLIHLLRNAVSHGIEEPSEREKQKKPRRGQITLSAHRERNYVFIELSDDGCGMDPNQIREIAIRKKILSQEELSRLSDQEVLMLITTPGFSITEKVTVVSGRGVGMNTVRSKVEAIGGSLTIDTISGKGSKFTLKLPLSMAIIQALLVGVVDETYCIPLSSITETMKISPGDIKTMEHHEVISYRNTVLPLVSLRERLGFNQPAAGETSNQKPETRKEKRIPVVVVEVGYKKAGLIVDKLLGQQEVVIKILAGNLKNIKGVAGATILGSGKVAMIIDVPSLI